MRITITLIALSTTLTISAQSLNDYFKKQDSLVKEIQIFKSKNDPSILAVIAATEPDWWETLAIVKVKSDNILWQASFDSLPGEQSIRSVKQIKLNGFTGLFFQVYGQTHMGNGFYYLYQLQGKKMILKACTRAVDRHQDGSYKINGDWREYDRIFTNDTLTVHYQDVNGDGYDDIKLTGYIEIRYDEKKVKSFSGQKVLVFNKQKNTFIEDRTQRRGFEKDDN
ncbi:MAG: hypothetical protein QM802_05310 [Agriterribacter sp.]